MEKLRKKAVSNKNNIAMFINITYNLGVKVRNMKMDFNTAGTWRRVGQ